MKLLFLNFLRNANLLFVIGILALLSSCNNNDDGPNLYLDVDPDNILSNFAVGSPVQFTIRVQSEESNLSRFFVLYREENETTKSTRIDTAISGRIFNHILDFERPPDQDRKYFIEFTAVNSAGKEVKQLRTAWIRYDSTTVPLKEFPGIVMYPKNSDMEDGYDIINEESIFTDPDLIGDNQADIYEVDFGKPNQVILTRQWRSATGGKFVRFNEFDYPNATLNTMMKAYEAGTKLEQLNEIEENDIIIFHSAQRNIWAVIKIDEIELGNDPPSTTPYYEFDLRK